MRGGALRQSLRRCPVIGAAPCIVSLFLHCYKVLRREDHCLPLPLFALLPVAAAGHKSVSGIEVGIEVTWFAYTVKNQFIPEESNANGLPGALSNESSFRSCLLLPSFPHSFCSSLLLFYFHVMSCLPSMLSFPLCAFCTYDNHPRDPSRPPPSGPSADTSTPIQSHSDSSTT